MHITYNNIDKEICKGSVHGMFNLRAVFQLVNDQ